MSGEALTRKVSDARQNRQQMIIDDLNARGLSVSSFIVVDKEDKLKIISYKNGLVDFISRDCENLNISERKGGNVVSPVAEINNKGEGK